MKSKLRDTCICFYLISCSFILVLFALKAVSDNMANITDMIEIAKNIANILFWIAVPVVSGLALKQANRTIFASERNEIFKVELKTTLDIYKYFNEKGNKLFFILDFPTIAKINGSRSKYFHATNLCENEDTDESKALIEEIKKGIRRLDEEAINGYDPLDSVSTRFVIGCLSDENGLIYDYFMVTKRYEEEIRKIIDFKNSYIPNDISDSISSFLDEIKRMNSELYMQMKSVEFNKSLTAQKLVESVNGKASGLLTAGMYWKYSARIENKANRIISSINKYLDQKN